MANVILIPVLQAIQGILTLYQWIIFISIILSWLGALGIVDFSRHTILANLYMLSRVITEPMFAWVRRFIPPLGMMDFSPVVVVVGISILQNIISRVIYHLSVVY